MIYSLIVSVMGQAVVLLPRCFVLYTREALTSMSAYETTSQGAVLPPSGNGEANASRRGRGILPSILRDLTPCFLWDSHSNFQDQLSVPSNL